MKLNPGPWLNLLVQLAIAAGTIGAVVVALYGGWLRSLLVPPRLKLSLGTTAGNSTPVSLTAPNGEVRQTKGRWYHVGLSNERRWSPASRVQVFLLRVEEPDAAGRHRVVWQGDIPIRLRNQEIKPLLKTIGHDEEYDLCSVIASKSLEIYPIITPYSLKARYDTNCHLVVTLQARGEETDSNILRVEIAWNGQWSDDAEVMARHMVVKDVSAGG